MYSKEIISYLNDIAPESENWVQALEEEAIEHHVPIMDKQGISILQQLVRLHQPVKILEIGTAIGYSALRMLEAHPQASIVTVERDQQMYERAIHNIERQQKQQNVDVILGDALEKETEILAKGPYNIIFIDAAKGQYRRFFESYLPALKSNGMIITDNVLFRGLVADASEAPKRLQNLANKIDQYNQWLLQHPSFHTTILPVGDGIAISIKKNE
ncbi:O-methyltransferase [Gracilibacillus caseinilyticus]|uniref:tRNA 5-hydroxyuridine methyltransferase n=1 Tax=Gracilibacillus caseinilyticus TaxID=2932256 RepID=A0ABY4EYV6_9BACI|nr:O-methyltransferase [Gracilibacillus caseinilyticus]UOQ47351.1 O-methyltransferase [Gracilibacillus caseinilyticus]